MKGIAVEHARHGIRANAIVPGWIETHMTAPAMGWDKFVDKVLPRIAAAKVGHWRRLRRRRRLPRERCLPLSHG